MPLADGGRGGVRFRRYIGIDYSGAGVPTTGVRGLQVYVATGAYLPVKERLTVGGVPRLWSRQAVAEWLIEQLRNGPPTVVGIDHGFSFPIEYFERHELEQGWRPFLDDFTAHWPTDSAAVRDVLKGKTGSGDLRRGETSWKRLTERRTPAAMSVFHFWGPGVAFSTHAGLPWLQRIRQVLGTSVHVWPFDGWEIPEGKSVLAEVYPSLWSAIYAPEGRNSDEHDAFSIAAWMREADQAGSLPRFFDPLLTEEERSQASREGWILGVGIKP